MLREVNMKRARLIHETATLSSHNDFKRDWTNMKTSSTEPTRTDTANNKTETLPEKNKN